MYKKIITILLSVTILFSTGCTQISQTNNNEQIIKQFNNINMTIDPRIELLSIIIYLSPNYKYSVTSIIPKDTSYKEKVEKHFGKYKEHKAVKLIDSMSYNNSFSYDAPPTAMVYLTNTPHLEMRKDIDKNDYVYKQCMERAGGEEKFLEFVKELNNFCEESDFYNFYNDNLDYYNKIIDTTIENLKDIDYITQIEDYYGKQQNSYNIILSGLLYANNYGPRIKNSSDEYDIYSIMGSGGVENDLPIFADDTWFKYLVRHEFGHSFVNHITTDNAHEVNKTKKLFIPIRSDMEKQAYPNWETSLNEHIVRAVVIRVTQIYEGKDSADEIMDMEQERSFIYVDEIVNLLKEEYEPNRNKYPTFESFYPEILKLLDELPKE